MERHLSSQFDEELNHISSSVLEMGGLVETQLRQAMRALHQLDTQATQVVLDLEERVNRLEVEIDAEITSVMCRRQPTARDLRLLVGVSRVIVNLERAGDEAARVARMTRDFVAAGAPRVLPLDDLVHAATLAAGSIRAALDAFARLDVPALLQVIDTDDRIDVVYEGFLRKLITFMMEDPRLITPCLNLTFLAKAIERIGDHAKNIAEAGVYVAVGKDIRHVSPQERESALK
ncbi:Phosphate-specific transport system accessory protein PhoU [Tepidimonas charontis]|uniref:Phosphate-specific transport system accessory protein PhoU n=2 Tax=Tepidimonas charontis TaxID=2267262 RepID=A0A554XGV2_9BURK|nr:Phosphate-specific transport system accessory protein PhoU [Tepidimonas charontis]